MAKADQGVNLPDPTTRAPKNMLLSDYHFVRHALAGLEPALLHERWPFDFTAEGTPYPKRAPGGWAYEKTDPSTAEASVYCYGIVFGNWNMHGKEGQDLKESTTVQGQAASSSVHLRPGNHASVQYFFAEESEEEEGKSLPVSTDLDQESENQRMAPTLGTTSCSAPVENYESAQTLPPEGTTLSDPPAAFESSQAVPLHGTTQSDPLAPLESSRAVPLHGTTSSDELAAVGSSQTDPLHGTKLSSQPPEDPEQGLGRSYGTKAHSKWMQ
ncbi:MAG: hypothetical protein Q9222_000090 [Ikaeria aurantiellina]